MTQERPDSRRALWFWFIAASAGFFLISLSGDVERATSPNIWGLQVVLRKSYSIVAFAIVGFLLARIRKSEMPDVFPVALMIAGYSAAIEVAQRLLGSHEGLYWNVIDTLCGFIGGFLGAALSLLQKRDPA